MPELRLATADLDSVRRALVHDLSREDLPDATILDPMVADLAVRDLLQRVPDAEARLTDIAQAPVLRAALVYLTAARLAPQLRLPTGESFDQYSVRYSGASYDPATAEARLRQTAGALLAELPTQDAAPTFPILTLAPGSRGDLSVMTAPGGSWLG